MTVVEIHLVDADENSYYCLSLCAYDNIFEEDVVKVYALPIGETSFDNISGGTTLAIMLAGCYIEKEMLTKAQVPSPIITAIQLCEA